MESRMREIRTYGLTRGKSHRRQCRGVGLYSTGIDNDAARFSDERRRGGRAWRSGMCLAVVCCRADRHLCGLMKN